VEGGKPIMGLRQSGGLIRPIKVMWLPLFVLLLIIIEPYTGIANTTYVWAYIGFQVLLFIIYAYIIYKDRPRFAGKIKP
jgi:hypothetical protein